MNNNEIVTPPDFEEWARSIKSLPPHSDHVSSIAQSLKNAFEQGVALGDRTGYERGLNKGWAIEQDAGGVWGIE